MEIHTTEQIDQFVAQTRTALFVRKQDQLLMIRPDKTMRINATAVSILDELYNSHGKTTADALRRLSRSLGVDPQRLLTDSINLIQAIGAILNEDYSDRPALRFGTFDRSLVAFPTLAEIALTYGCQNRCLFCYASSPQRGQRGSCMTTKQVQLVMDKIFHQGHVPSLSFTGGESTLRHDLTELIGYGSRLGFRINLISNGLRCADKSYAQQLVQAGLASAQISLEAGEAELHDLIVGKSGAFAQTVAGVGQLQQLGIHVHTNTTLCSKNLKRAPQLIRFVANQLKSKTLSMNMVIRTGDALEGSMAGEEPIGVSYSEVSEQIPGLLEVAREEGVKLVWYSPIPYCIFNPVLHDLGAKSCACVDGILSVDPMGQVLPCSSFESGIGSLLRDSFDDIYNSEAAQYWRQKKFVPPVCADCNDVDICAGGCPLYWDAASDFSELPLAGASDPKARLAWEYNREKSESFGVRPPVKAQKEEAA